jgi:predicted aspartyl protease
MEAETLTSYNQTFDPPAPMLEVSVAHIRTRPRVALPALLDTGADMTAVPEFLVKRLNLYQIGQMAVEDVNGFTEIVSTYVARLIIADQIVPEHKVLVTGLDFVVIGRDLLNQFYFLANGPEKTFTLRTTPFS